MEDQTITTVGQTNALVLANAVEIGARVIGRIAGNDIANTLNGETASKEKLAFLLSGQMVKHLQAKVKQTAV